MTVVLIIIIIILHVYDLNVQWVQDISKLNKVPTQFK